jgi:hypothetical protein
MGSSRRCSAAIHILEQTAIRESALVTGSQSTCWCLVHEIICKFLSHKSGTCKNSQWWQQWVIMNRNNLCTCTCSLLHEIPQASGRRTLLFSPNRRAFNLACLTSLSPRKYFCLDWSGVKSKDLCPCRLSQPHQGKSDCTQPTRAPNLPEGCIRRSAALPARRIYVHCISSASSSDNDTEALA